MIFRVKGLMNLNALQNAMNNFNTDKKWGREASCTTVGLEVLKAAGVDILGDNAKSPLKAWPTSVSVSDKVQEVGVFNNEKLPLQGD